MKTYLVYDENNVFQLAIASDADFKITGRGSALDRVKELADDVNGYVKDDYESEEPIYKSGGSK